MTMMKVFCAVTKMTSAGSAIAGTANPSQVTHRYLIERTFPAGAAITVTW
jgi:hypothetical protein